MVTTAGAFVTVFVMHRGSRCSDGFFALCILGTDNTKRFAFDFKERASTGFT
jgi:hypothetical protein